MERDSLDRELRELNSLERRLAALDGLHRRLLELDNLQSKLTESSAEPGQTLKKIFLILLTISLGLWGYVVLTTTIDRVPIASFPVLHMMPPIYWVGVALLILATVIWYFSPQTRWYHFILLLSWTLYIFVGPNLVEAGITGYDTLGHLQGVTYIEQGKFSEYLNYRDWPGFIFLFHFIYEVTDIGYYVLPKLASTFLNLARALFIIYLGTRLFPEKKHALLFSLVLIPSFWSLGVSPQHLGILLMLCLLALCFSPGQLGMRRRGLIIILFAVLIMTHMLTALAMTLLLILFSLMSLTGKDFGYSRDIRGYTLATVSVVMFVAYLMNISAWVFRDAVKLAQKAILEPFGILAQPIGFLAPYSSYQAFAWQLAYLYFGVLLLWGLFVVFRRKFWSRPILERIFPLLCLIPIALFTFVAYGGASLPRFYLFAIPFIVWFLVRESQTFWRAITPLLLILLLVLSFAEYWAIEYVQYVPTEEFAGAKFVTSKMPPSGYTYYVVQHDPAPMSMANVLTQPPIAGKVGLRRGARAWDKYQEGDFQFTVWSTRQKQQILFHYGDEALPRALERLYRDDHNVIYSNGDLQIYAIVYRGHEWPQ